MGLCSHLGLFGCTARDMSFPAASIAGEPGKTIDAGPVKVDRRSCLATSVITVAARLCQKSRTFSVLETRAVEFSAYRRHKRCKNTAP